MTDQGNINLSHARYLVLSFKSSVRYSTIHRLSPWTVFAGFVMLRGASRQIDRVQRSLARGSIRQRQSSIDLVLSMSDFKPPVLTGMKEKTSLEEQAVNSLAATKLSDTRTSQVVSTLLEEMRTRWSRGERPLCDEYLALLSGPARTEGNAVDLIYCEYGLRQFHGLYASPASFLARFPDYQEPLKRQFDLDSALDSTLMKRPEPIEDPGSEHPLLRNRPLPASLGRYLVVAPVDSGGQADVYLALHPTLRKNVILKLGRRPVSGDSTSEEIQREGRILASLEHKNLVRVYDVEIVQGYPLVVMEYLSGQSLDQSVRRQRPSVAEAARIVSTIARAVGYVHRQNLLHLDIKPRNIMLDENGVPRLIDFGLARLDDAWQKEGIDDQLISGTLQYMAPEQVTGDREMIGPAADIFALGGALYFLVTGQPPYPASTFQELVPQVRQGKWNQTLLNQAVIPSALKKVCTKALAVDPAKRFATAEEFAKSVESAVSHSWRKAIGILAVILLVGGLWGAWQALRPVSPQPLISAVPLEPLSDFTIDVWANDHFVDIQDRLPLMNGDELRMELHLPAGQQGILFYRDSQQGWKVLEEWESQPENRLLYYPDHDASLPLAGEPGTQILLLCVAEDLQHIREQVLKLSRENHILPALDPYTLVHIDLEEFRSENFSRSFGPPVKRTTAESEVRQETRTIQSLAKEHSVSLVGIAFSKK